MFSHDATLPALRFSLVAQNAPAIIVKISQHIATATKCHSAAANQTYCVTAEYKIAVRNTEILHLQQSTRTPEQRQPTPDSCSSGDDNTGFIHLPVDKNL
jgi:hypothetical protein